MLKNRDRRSKKLTQYAVNLPGKLCVSQTAS